MIFHGYLKRNPDINLKSESMLRCDQLDASAVATGQKRYLRELPLPVSGGPSTVSGVGGGEVSQ